MEEFFLWNFFGVIFWEKFFEGIFFRRIFWEDFLGVLLGGFFWEELFGRIQKITLTVGFFSIVLEYHQSYLKRSECFKLGSSNHIRVVGSQHRISNFNFTQSKTNKQGSFIKKSLKFQILRLIRWTD